MKVDGNIGGGIDGTGGGNLGVIAGQVAAAGPVNPATDVAVNFHRCVSVRVQPASRVRPPGR